MFNSLLDLMSEAVRDELLLSGAPVTIEAGGSVPQEHLGGDYVFIVLAGVVSKLQVSESGHLSEIGMVGNEGLFPLSGLLGVPAAPHLVVCQVGPLRAQRLRTRDFHRILSESVDARVLLRKYIYSFITQIASNIASSEQGMVSAKLARWLLMCHDRIEGDCIPITHDMLAQIIFAHRPTVSIALKMMRHQGLVDIARGAVIVRSRSGLEQLADGKYGLSERYWQAHIGPFGKDFRHADEDRLPQQGQLRA